MKMFMFLAVSAAPAQSPPSVSLLVSAIDVGPHDLIMSDSTMTANDVRLAQLRELLPLLKHQWAHFNKPSVPLAFQLTRALIVLNGSVRHLSEYIKDQQEEFSKILELRNISRPPLIKRKRRPLRVFTEETEVTPGIPTPELEQEASPSPLSVDSTQGCAVTSSTTVFPKVEFIGPEESSVPKIGTSLNSESDLSSTVQLPRLSPAPVDSTERWLATDSVTVVPKAEPAPVAEVAPSTPELSVIKRELVPEELIASTDAEIPAFPQTFPVIDFSLEEVYAALSEDPLSKNVESSASEIEAVGAFDAYRSVDASTVYFNPVVKLEKTVIPGYDDVPVDEPSKDPLLPVLKPTSPKREPNDGQLGHLDKKPEIKSKDTAVSREDTGSDEQLRLDQLLEQLSDPAPVLSMPLLEGYDVPKPEEGSIRHAKPYASSTLVTAASSKSLENSSASAKSKSIINLFGRRNSSSEGSSVKSDASHSNSLFVATSSTQSSHPKKKKKKKKKPKNQTLTKVVTSNAIKVPVKVGTSKLFNSSVRSVSKNDSNERSTDKNVSAVVLDNKISKEPSTSHSIPVPQNKLSKESIKTPKESSPLNDNLHRSTTNSVKSSWSKPVPLAGHIFRMDERKIKDAMNVRLGLAAKNTTSKSKPLPPGKHLNTSITNAILYKKYGIKRCWVSLVRLPPVMKIRRSNATRTGKTDSLDRRLPDELPFGIQTRLGAAPIPNSTSTLLTNKEQLTVASAEVKGALTTKFPSEPAPRLAPPKTQSSSKDPNKTPGCPTSSKPNTTRIPLEETTADSVVRKPPGKVLEEVAVRSLAPKSMGEGSKHTTVHPGTIEPKSKEKVSGHASSKKVPVGPAARSASPKIQSFSKDPTKTPGCSTTSKPNATKNLLEETSVDSAVPILPVKVSEEAAVRSRTPEPISKEKVSGDGLSKKVQAGAATRPASPKIQSSNEISGPTTVKPTVTKGPKVAKAGSEDIAAHSVKPTSAANGLNEITISYVIKANLAKEIVGETTARPVTPSEISCSSFKRTIAGSLSTLVEPDLPEAHSAEIVGRTTASLLRHTTKIISRDEKAVNVTQKSQEEKKTPIVYSTNSPKAESTGSGNQRDVSTLLSKVPLEQKDISFHKLVPKLKVDSNSSIDPTAPSYSKLVGGTMKRNHPDNNVPPFQPKVPRISLDQYKRHRPNMPLRDPRSARQIACRQNELKSFSYKKPQPMDVTRFSDYTCHDCQRVFYDKKRWKDHAAECIGFKM